jgi:hypothetical protein
MQEQNHQKVVPDRYRIIQQIVHVADAVVSTAVQRIGDTLQR